MWSGSSPAPRSPTETHVWLARLCVNQAATLEMCLWSEAPGKPQSTRSTAMCPTWTGRRMKWWTTSGTPRSAENWGEFICVPVTYCLHPVIWPLTLAEYLTCPVCWSCTDWPLLLDLIFLTNDQSIKDQSVTGRPANGEWEAVLWDHSTNKHKCLLYSYTLH